MLCYLLVFSAIINNYSCVETIRWSSLSKVDFLDLEELLLMAND